MGSSDDFQALQHLSASIVQICEDIQKLLSSLDKQEEASDFSHDVAALATAVESAKSAAVSSNIITPSEAFILVHDCEFPLRQAAFTLRSTRDIKAVSTYADILKGRTVPLLSLYRRSSYQPAVERATELSPPPRKETESSPPPPPAMGPSSPNAKDKQKEKSKRKMSGASAADDKNFKNHDMVTKWVSNLKMYDDAPGDKLGLLSPERRGTGASAMTTSATVGDRKSRVIQSEADVDAILLRQSQVQAIKAFEENRLEAAKDIAKDALEIASRLDDKLALDPPDTWKLEQILVESCLKQSQWEEAGEILHRMGEDDSLAEEPKLWILHWLAELYMGQGKLDDAESYGWQAWRKRAVLLGMSHPSTQDSIRLTVKIKDAKGDAKSEVLEAMLRENTPETAALDPGSHWDKDRSDSVWTIPSPISAPTHRTDSVASLFAPTMTSLSSRPTAADYETAALSPVNTHEWLHKHDYTINAEGKLVETTLPLSPTSPVSASSPHLHPRRESFARNKENTLIAIFHEAASRGDDKIVSLILGNPKDPNNRPLVPSVNVHSPTSKQTALHRAAMKNNISTALLLVDYGADVNDFGPDQGSPLHFAASRGHSAMVRLLLELGANIDAQTPQWPYTPLRVAVSTGKEDVVQDLISRGANLESQDNEGWTPLIAAAKCGRENVVKLLLDAGANPKAQDRDRWTALHSAAYGGFDNIAKILIDKGADLSVTHVVGDMSKKTAWDIAKNRKHYHMRPLLQPQGPGFFETIENAFSKKRKNSRTSALST